MKPQIVPISSSTLLGRKLNFVDKFMLVRQKELMLLLHLTFPQAYTFLFFVPWKHYDRKNVTAKEIQQEIEEQFKQILLNQYTCICVSVSVYFYFFNTNLWREET